MSEGIAADLPRIGFGAAYYPEYLEPGRIAVDLDLMARAGFTMIRVGESVWSTWEPADGDFRLDWLAPVLEGAHERGIDVVLGTPTYAVPPWLMKAHPEIAAERATGVRVPWGVRQETEIGHPVFRRYAERIIRAVVGRYAAHPAVVGIQVDNEPGQHLAHNAHVVAEFRDWLLNHYGSVAALNEAWNLTHWSHRLTDIDQLWLADGNHVPQYDLAWRRFHAERTVDYIRWQVGIVRELVDRASSSRHVSTGCHPRPMIGRSASWSTSRLPTSTSRHRMHSGSTTRAIRHFRPRVPGRPSCSPTVRGRWPTDRS